MNTNAILSWAQEEYSTNADVIEQVSSAVIFNRIVKVEFPVLVKVPL